MFSANWFFNFTGKTIFAIEANGRIGFVTINQERVQVWLVDSNTGRTIDRSCSPLFYSKNYKNYWLKKAVLACRAGVRANAQHAIPGLIVKLWERRCHINLNL